MGGIAQRDKPVIKIMHHNLAPPAGNIHTIVAMIQPEINALGKHLRWAIFMTSIPILTVCRGFSSNIGIFKCPRRAPGANKVAQQDYAPAHQQANVTQSGFCITGNTAVTVFSVNNCWRAMMTMIKPKVAAEISQ